MVDSRSTQHQSNEAYCTSRYHVDLRFANHLFGPSASRSLIVFHLLPGLAPLVSSEYPWHSRPPMKSHKLQNRYLILQSRFMG
jgi:hypothetical protein